MGETADYRTVVHQLIAASEKMREQALLARKQGAAETCEYLLKKSAQYRDQAISLTRLGKR